MYSALIFFLFIVLYIWQLFQQLNAKYGNDIGKAAQNRTINNAFGYYDNQYTCDKLYFDQITPQLPRKYPLNKVADGDFIIHWLSYVFSRYATNYIKPNNYAHLLNGKFRITLRKGKALNITSYMDKFFGQASSLSELDKKLRENEDTKDYELMNSKGEVIRIARYSYDGGYLGKGGYVEYWDYNDIVPEEDLGPISYYDTQAGIFICNVQFGYRSIWEVAVDFVLYEAETEVYVYKALVIRLTEASDIVTKVESYPLYFKEFNTIEGIGNLILIIIVAIFIIYFFINAIIECITAWKEYKKWFAMERLYFSKMELFQRSEKCPEVLRNLHYFFNFFKILVLGFLVFSIL